jgi:hypothetical protein
MRSIAVPVVVLFVTLAILETASDGRDLYALPLLLPLAMLGASVVPTLPRWPSAILDRLGTVVFSVVILTLWVGWLALNTGHPMALSGWMHRTHPAYVPSFRLFAFVVAILFTVSWFLLLLRSSGKRDGKHAVLSWAAGMSFAWGIAMAILVPWLDAGNSYRSMMISLNKAIPPGIQDVVGISVDESPRAMLDYYVGVKVQRFDPEDQDQDDLLLVKNEPTGKEQVDAGWCKIWEGARPGDTKEIFRLYSRKEETDKKLPLAASSRKLKLKKVRWLPRTGAS